MLNALECWPAFLMAMSTFFGFGRLSASRSKAKRMAHDPVWRPRLWPLGFHQLVGHMRWEGIDDSVIGPLSIPIATSSEVFAWSALVAPSSHCGSIPDRALWLLGRIASGERCLASLLVRAGSARGPRSRLGPPR